MLAEYLVPATAAMKVLWLGMGWLWGQDHWSVVVSSLSKQTVSLNVPFCCAPNSCCSVLRLMHEHCKMILTFLLQKWHNSLGGNPGGRWCHGSVDLELAGEENASSKLQQQLPCVFLREELWAVLTVGSSQRLTLWFFVYFNWLWKDRGFCFQWDFLWGSCDSLASVPFLLFGNKTVSQTVKTRRQLQEIMNSFNLLSADRCLSNFPVALHRRKLCGWPSSLLQQLLFVFQALI